MSIAVVQSTGNSGYTFGSSYSQAFASANTAGNVLIAIGFANPPGQIATFTVTDNASGGSNQWSQLAVIDSNGTSTLFTAFICYSCKGTGSPITVSLNQNQGSGVAGILFCIAEISGVNALDQIATSANALSAAVNSTNITTQFAAEIVIQALQSDGTSEPQIAGGYTQLGATPTSNSYVIAGYQIVASAGSKSADFANQATNDNGVILFSLYQKTGIPGALTMLGCGAS
jgi:hypothetical protein